MRRLQNLLTACTIVVIAVVAAAAAAPTTNLYVSTTGSDLNTCARTAPCKTIERACSMLPADISTPYVIHVGSGTYSAGCHLVGRRQAGATNLWSTPGSVTIRGTLTTYAPSDAGTGTALLGWVDPGEGATRDVWGFDAGAYNADELKGMLACVTSGTGANPERCWPVATNTADRMTLQAVSLEAGPAVAPAAGSGVTFKTWGTVVNGNLADSAASSAQARSSLAGAFVANGESAALPFISIERIKFGTSATNGVLFRGPVSFRENWCTNTSGTCFLALDGTTTPTVERNVKSGAGDFVGLGAGAHAPSVRMYNNLEVGSVGDFLDNPSQAATLLGATNTSTPTVGPSTGMQMWSDGGFHNLEATGTTTLTGPLDAHTVDAGFKYAQAERHALPGGAYITADGSGNIDIHAAGNGNTVNGNWQFSGQVQVGTLVTTDRLHTTSTQTVGTVSLTGGAGTATTFSGAKCVCSNNTDATKPCSAPVTSTTVNITSGSGTDSATYICL